MALETTNTYDEYSGNGSTSTYYPITFAYLDSSHIVMTVDGDPYANFTVDATNGVQTGTAIASGSKVRITRQMPILQTYEFSESSKVDLSRVEEAHDYLCMCIQQVRDSDVAALTFQDGFMDYNNIDGEDSETISIVVANPPYANTKSVRFNNNYWLGANAALLDATLGRSGNGSGSGDAWSVAFWFFAGTSNNQNQTIFYFGSNDVNNGNHIAITYNGDNSARRRIIFRYGSTNNNILLSTPVGSVAASDGWQHILVTYDGGTTGGASSGDTADYYSRFKIFIDGVQQTTTNSNSNYGISSSLSGQNLRVGRLNTSSYMRNGCKVDELAIFDSDQSGNVSAIYNGGVPFDLGTLGTQPKHWWRMGDGDTYPNLQDSGTEANCVFVMSNMTVADIVSDVP